MDISLGAERAQETVLSLHRHAHLESFSLFLGTPFAVQEHDADICDEGPTSSDLTVCASRLWTVSLSSACHRCRLYEHIHNVM